MNLQQQEAMSCDQSCELLTLKKASSTIPSQENSDARPAHDDDSTCGGRGDSLKNDGPGRKRRSRDPRRSSPVLRKGAEARVRLATTTVTLGLC